MYCKNCGRDVGPDTNFCPHCGVRLKGTGDEYRRRNDFSEDNNEQFYKQTWFGILMLFVFWPVGLYLLIKYGGSFTKIVFGIFAGLITLLFFGLFFIGCSLDMLTPDIPANSDVQIRIEDKPQQEDGSFSDKVLEEMRKAAVSL